MTTATSTAAYPLMFTISNQDDYITRLKRKENKAFRRLYDDYSAALYGRIFQSIREKTTAEDILQNVFVKTWMNIGTFDPEKGSLTTWILNICRNEIIDHYRKKHSQKRQVDEGYAKAFYNTLNDVTHDRIDAAKFMASLATKDRVLIDLIYFRGFTYQQSSVLLQVPVGTIKTRIRTLLKNWRTFYQIHDRK